MLEGEILLHQSTERAIGFGRIWPGGYAPCAVAKRVV